jgi:hypothetical protein
MSFGIYQIIDGEFVISFGIYIIGDGEFKTGVGDWAIHQLMIGGATRNNV